MGEILRILILETLLRIGRHAMRASIVFCLGILFATAAFADQSDPCDPRYHWFSPPDCTTAAKRIFDAVAKFRGAIAEQSERIAQARARFWATYPNKPGAAKARDEFATQLYWKDMYYVYASLATPTLQSDRGNPVGSRQALDFLGEQLDGGIRRSAGPEFEDWVAQVKQNMGPDPLSSPLQMNNEDVKKVLSLSFPQRFLKAVEASKSKHDVYVIERDWAEFDAAGREPAGLDDPAVYFPALCVRLQKIGWDDAFSEYNGLVKALGADAVRKAILEVHAAPKASGGRLRVTVPDPLKRTPSGDEVPDPSVPEPDIVIGLVASPIWAVERLAAKDDDRRYLLSLLAQEWLDDHRGTQATKWQYADAAYRHLAVAFSEKDILQVARQVRTATKRMTNGRIMHEEAISSTRTEPFAAFEDILARANPHGYVNVALALNQKLDTVARVRAAYAKFVSSHGEEEVLEAARRAAAGRPYLTDDKEIEVIERELENPSAQATEQTPKLADSPSYLKWKGFPAGSKATYIWRGLNPPKTGTGMPVPGRTEIRNTYLLQSIDSEHADTWTSEVVYDYPSGQAHSPHETEWDYPAKDRIQPNAGQRIRPNARVAGPPIQSGDQALTIGGKTLQTHWEVLQTSPDKCPDFLVTTWYSAEVPGELVRKVEDENCRGNRRIYETLLETMQGSRSSVELAAAEKRLSTPAGDTTSRSSSPPFPMASEATQGTAPGGRSLPQSTPYGRPAANGRAATPTTSRTLPPPDGAVDAPPSGGVAVPQGTLLYAHLAGMVNSSVSKKGSTFFGSLDQALTVNGVEIAPRGTPVTAQLAELPNGGGLTLRLTDITIGGHKYAINTSQVSTSTSRSAQSNAADSALSQIFDMAGPAAAVQARRAAAAREQQRANLARQVMVNGPRIYVLPVTPLVFTLGGETVL